MRVHAYTRHATMRTRNQDRAVVGRAVLEETGSVEHHDLDTPALLGVFDGLGGHPAGDVASEIGARVVAEADLPTGPDDAEALLRRAHRALLEAARREPHLVGMGTTAVFAVVDRGEALVANVGDSTAWRLAGDELEELSVADRGGFGLLQCLGGYEPDVEVVPHVSTIPLAPGDRLLLASDGLTDVVPLELIRTALRGDAGEAAGQLAEAVEQSGLPDDLTIVICTVDAAAQDPAGTG